MHDTTTRILARVAGELLARSSAIKRYLASLEDSGLVNYSQLTTTISKAIEKIEEDLRVTAETVRSSLEKGVDSEAAEEVFFASLERFARWFVSIHQLLVYLPTQAPKPEATAVMTASFGEVFDTLKPSIILGSLINALEFDFQKVVTDRLPDLGEIVFSETRNIVLQIPICDRESPSTWAILAHELGHAADHFYEISSSVVPKLLGSATGAGIEILRSWAKEVCADLIAASTLGPAGILTVIGLEHCVFPLRKICDSTRTHPSTRARLELVSSFLTKRYGFDTLERERESYVQAWEYSLKRAWPASDHAQVRDRHRNGMEAFFSPLATRLAESVEQLPIPKHTLTQDSLARCDSRLTRGLPISAQGAPRPDLRDKLTTYRGASFGTVTDRRDAFQKLTADFAEQPLEMASILTSCHKRKEQIMSTFASALLTREPTKPAALSAGLETLESLVASSINTSAIHQRLLNTKSDEGAL